MEDQNLQRGIQLFEIGRYADAVQFFKSAVAENPQDVTAKYFIALCFLNTGRFSEVEEMISSLRAEDPDNSDIMYLEAKTKFHLNKDNQALTLIDIAIGMNPTDDDYFALKADILMHLKKMKNSLENADKALTLNPKNTYALNIRAKVLTKLGQKEEAASTIENILYDNPEDDYSHTNVGWVELENGNVKKALEHFKEALSLNPNLEYARQGMSTALKSKNYIYSLYLKYSFWISNQSNKNQWFFIIGIYLVYRFSVNLLKGLGLSYLAIPLIILYLLFALGSWLMEPLSNTILNFDRYGKYLLDKEEKYSGMAFGILLIGGILSGILFYILKIDYILVLAVTFLCLLIPFPRSLLLSSSKAKNLISIYCFAMLIVGVAGTFFIGEWISGLIVFLMMILYTWIGNFIESK